MTLRVLPYETVWDNNMSAIQTSETQVPDITQEDVKFPPCGLYSDEPELESYLHLQQIIILLSCLEWFWRERNDFFAAGNLTIYYNEQQLKSRDFRGPDFFVVLGTDRTPRKSWTIWEEGGKYPNFIVEILSPSTANVDRSEKKLLYQDVFRTPDYFWFDPNTLEFQGFHLLDGVYQPLQPNAEGWLWSQQLELYLGITQQQLRFFTPEGTLVPTLQETTTEAYQQTEQARLQTEQAQQQAEQARLQTEQAQQQAEQARLQAEQAQQQAEQARLQAEQAQQQTEQAQHQLERERQRSQQLMQKLREMGVEIE
jgi:Uma2 family endonuclease